MFRRTPAPVVSEHAKLRSRQISEFLKLNPTAQSVANGLGAGDTTATYTLQLATHTAGILQLTVILGPLFPERPPVCQVTGVANAGLKLQHRFMDANGYLSLHPKLQAAHWSPHQNLGLLIQDLVRELIAQPPVLAGAAMPAFSAANVSPFMQQQQQQHLAQQQQYNMQQVPPAYQMPQQQQQPQPPQQPSPMIAPYPSPSSLSASSPYGQPSAQAQSALSNSTPLPTSSHLQTPPIPPRKSSNSTSPAAASRTRPPDVPTSFPSLDGLSIAQLEALLAGTPEAQSLALKDLAAETTEVAQMEETQRQLCTRIDELVQTNLSRREELETLVARVSIAQAKFREQQQTYQSLLARQQAAAQKYSLGNILALLDQQIDTIDTQSDATKSRYESHSGGAAADAEQSAVLEQYIKERMMLHERAAKKERLVEIYGRP